MGIPNFFGQESQLNGLEGDIQQIREYVAGMNGCLGELNACWSGSSDKRVAVGGIQRHLGQANSVANSINDFKDTALHVLRRINELGRVTGIGWASIGIISIMNIFDAFHFGTRINVDTGALRAVADKVAGEKRRLCDVEFSIKSTKNVIDSVILNIFGLSRKLRNIDKQVDQLEAANDRIVGSLRQICDVYEQTEASLKQRAIEIMDVESHTDVFTAAAVTSFAVNTPKAKPGGGDGGGAAGGVAGGGGTPGSPVSFDGEIRYITQLKNSNDFDPSLWGGHDPKYGCGVACTSMALSALGIDRTPAEICDVNQQHGPDVWMQWDLQGAAVDRDTGIDFALARMASDPKKYAPPIIHLPGHTYGPNYDSHYLVITGKNADGSYTMLDPASGRTVAEPHWIENLDQVFQYYL